MCGKARSSLSLLLILSTKAMAVSRIKVGKVAVVMVEQLTTLLVDREVVEVTKEHPMGQKRISTAAAITDGAVSQQVTRHLSISQWATLWRLNPHLN